MTQINQRALLKLEIKIYDQSYFHYKNLFLIFFLHLQAAIRNKSESKKQKSSQHCSPKK